MNRFWLGLVAWLASGLLLPLSALAQDGRIAKGEPWQFGFQRAATDIMERITGMHNFLLVIITGIALLVLFLLLFVMIRYNARANPTPSKTSHNTLLEVFWTAVPVMILIVIAIPSMRLLYYEDTIPESDMVLKITGHQWYWSYEYPDYNDISFDAFLLPDEYYDPQASAAVAARRADDLENLRVMLGRDKAPEIYRLLDTDNRVVVPVGKTVKILVTSDDVIHSWAVPAFGIKLDAVPGRINEAWFAAEETGTYYGQCSELCGKDHAFMPIVVEVVSEEDFKAWLGRAADHYASNSRGDGSALASAKTEKITAAKLAAASDGAN